MTKIRLKGQRSRSQRDVTYQQYKRYNSGTNKLTEFKVGENNPSAERNIVTKKKLCSRLSSRKAHFYTENGKLSSLKPPLGVRGNVRCSSYAHWKACSRILISHY